jgi:uncharacterized protein YciI
MDAGEIEALRAERAKLMRKQFYVVFMNPVKAMHDPAETHPEVVRDHLAFHRDLEARGILFGAGPFRDKAAGDWNASEWDGSGMAIIRAKSRAEAEEIATADPMHKAGLRINEVRPWQMNEGGFSLTIRYMTGAFDLV